jgi:hypothetical protein
MKSGAPPDSDLGMESPVPGAMGRLLWFVEERLGVETLDRLWVFPPLVKGRKEWGLVAVSCLGEDPAARILVTGRYLAEMTGNGPVFEPDLTVEGSVPPERLPPIMDGVVRRSELSLGTPREFEIRGSRERMLRLRVHYAPDQDPGFEPER